MKVQLFDTCATWTATGSSTARNAQPGSLAETVKFIFQNENFAVVDKPHGSLTVPSRMGDQEHRPCLGLQLQNELGKRVWPVHRLDFEVSGIVLFALTAEAHRAASIWFENHSIRKVYEAWSSSISPSTPTPPLDARQHWKSCLVRGKKRSFEADYGKPAETFATATESMTRFGQNVTVWRLEPITGRSHQLRYELRKHDQPIVGDTLYGSPVTLTEHPDTIALRAIELRLPDEARLNWRLPPEFSVAGLAATLI